MHSLQNSKYRRIRNRIRTAVDRLSFNFFHLKASQRVVVIGLISSAIAVFMPWFSVGKEMSGTAFSLSLGYVGYVKLVILAGVFVMAFSHRTKSELRSRSGLAMSDYAFCLFASVCLFALDFSTINVIRGFSIFTKDVALGNGPALSLVGDLFVLVGGAVAYREHKRELFETTFVENSRTTAEMLEEYDAIIGKDAPDKKNMSLPV